jgi:hypothetical protein
MPRPVSIPALLCAVLLALPPGWCCAASGGTCCGKRPPSPALPTCPDCCCDQPAPHQDAPPRTPPKKAACCERPAGILDRADAPDGTPAGADAPLPLDGPAIAPTSAGDLSPPAASPPFRILHCVWRC